jgi:hypothetical protein
MAAAGVGVALVGSTEMPLTASASASASADTGAGVGYLKLAFGHQAPRRREPGYTFAITGPWRDHRS